MEPFIGEIRMVAFPYPPLGWALCNGQMLQIREFQALFGQIGAYYGGDGENTFALPDLRSRVPIHQGTGTGLSARYFGEIGGAETAGLPHSVAQISQSPTNPEPLTSVMGDNPVVSTMQPFVVVNFIIALEGILPSRGPEV